MARSQHPETVEQRARAAAADRDQPELALDVDRDRYSRPDLLDDMADATLGSSLAFLRLHALGIRYDAEH